MCGFAGFVSPDSIEGDVLRGMGGALAHRGPDAMGYWSDESNKVGMAHRRLAIVDLSAAGAQPMYSSCNRFVIAFNGEVYNHLELRQKLESGSGNFNWRGHSDTETLLACFVSWGIRETLQAAVGMFAIALWDRDTETLTLARDRMGEKPLYWSRQNQALVFGSELKALRAFPSFNNSINRDSLALFVRHNYIPAPYTIYKEVFKLLPGQYFSVTRGQDFSTIQPQSYWSVNGVVEDGIRNRFSGSENDAVLALEQKLECAIAGQAVADVPLGAFLSGGVDSSLVVALMQQQSLLPIRTFTIGFDEPGYDEAEHAKAVARHLHTEHTELYVGAAEALAVIPKLANIYCEPFADSSQLPTFLVSEMAKKDVTVALSGDGGDELFGGYNTYNFTPKIWKRLSLVSPKVRQVISRFSHGLSMPAKLRKLVEVCDAPTRELLFHLLQSHWKNTDELVIGSREVPTIFTQPDRWPQSDSFEHWMMALDAQAYMVDDVLVKVDRAAMANSLETRVPLLDHRVVEFAWQLPLNMKIRNGTGKWILRELLYRHVPRELIERPKKGFSIPLDAWLRGPLREWAEALLDPMLLAQQGYFHPEPINVVWQQHLAGKADHSRKLWSILMFQAWLEEQSS